MTTQTKPQGEGSPMPVARSWYAINRFTNKAGDSEAEIKIYEDIGLRGITAKQFADDLEKIEAKTISVRLNTYGGETFDGIAIYNALRAHPAEIIVHVDGIAASAGSIIAMSGDEIRMADNAFMMIHEARGGAFGEADDMRKYGDMLDKLNDSVAITYQSRAGKTRKYWREKMAEETWYTAEEAKEAGLTDKIDDRESQAENRFDFRCYNQVRHVPEAVLKAWGKNNPTQTSAPEDSQRSEPPPASQTQERQTMSATETQAAPAQPPAAGTTQDVTQGITLPNNSDPLRAQEIQGYVEQGRSIGVEEGRKQERDRMKAIAEACPNKPAMALKAFIDGQNPNAVKMAFEAAAVAEAAAEQRIMQIQEENRRQVALAAQGGYPGGVGVALDDGEGTGEGDEGSGQRITPEAAKEAAGREWDRNPKVRKGFTSKANYVATRSAELRGLLARR